MQRTWSADEWSLLPEDLALLEGRIDAGKLGFAVQLAFWRQHGRFPDEEADVGVTTRSYAKLKSAMKSGRFTNGRLRMKFAGTTKSANSTFITLFQNQFQRQSVWERPVSVRF
jgi:hypothetical protein